MQMYDMALWFLGIGMVILSFIQIKPNKEKSTELNLNMAGAMTIGSREVQEDCFYINQNQQGSFLALADGMGESYGGRIAARTAIAVCEDMFSAFNILDNPRYFFRNIFNLSNKEILKALDNGGKGYASLATALIYDKKLFYSVVGNVKVFVFRSGDLVEVSVGHTLERISKTEFAKGKITRSEARALLDNHRLYNFLGQDGFSDLEIFDTPITLKNNDIVLLMTDGIYDILSFKELESVLSKNVTTQKKAYEIIELVNQNTSLGKDNGSIVIWQNMGATV